MGGENDQTLIFHVHQGHHYVLRFLVFGMILAVFQGSLVAMVTVRDEYLLVFHHFFNAVYGLVIPDYPDPVGYPLMVSGLEFRRFLFFFLQNGVDVLFLVKVDGKDLAEIRPGLFQQQPPSYFRSFEGEFVREDVLPEFLKFYSGDETGPLFFLFSQIEFLGINVKVWLFILFQKTAF